MAARKRASKGRAPATPAPPPAERDGPRCCKAVALSGKPCRSPPLKGSEFCSAHDPRPEAKAKFHKAASAGGKAATAQADWTSIEISSREDLRRFVNQVLDQVATKKMLPKVSYALAPHLTIMAKLFDEPTCQQPERGPDLLPTVLAVLDAHPDAKDEMVKLIEATSP